MRCARLASYSSLTLLHSDSCVRCQLNYVLKNVKMEGEMDTIHDLLGYLDRIALDRYHSSPLPALAW